MGRDGLTSEWSRRAMASVRARLIRKRYAVRILYKTILLTKRLRNPIVNLEVIEAG